ncbi:MAG: class I SAM-dependent methyltransferase [Bacillota bacterium]
MQERQDFYRNLSEEYDLMVDWPSRLSRELPFLTGVLQKQAGKKVIDAACGTGNHGLALAELGWEVTGTDASPEMVAIASTRAERWPNLKFYQLRLGELARQFGEEKFDALLCLGNSLPHVLERPQLEQTIGDFALVLKSGGVAVVQLLNYQRIFSEAERFLAPVSRKTQEGERLFLRFYDFLPENYLDFNLVVLRQQGGTWQQQVETTRLRGWLARELLPVFRSQGFTRIELYGDYQGNPYQELKAKDLIIVAYKADGEEMTK